MSERQFNIICGHYGCGKSNYSINLAMEMAKEGRKVMLVDLDLVNPYFLSSGYKDMLEQNNIKVIAPLFANTNVETPALPADLNLIFETDMDLKRGTLFLREPEIVLDVPISMSPQTVNLYSLASLLSFPLIRQRLILAF